MSNNHLSEVFIMMKKIIAVALALMMLIGIACASAEVLTGGWSIAETTEITEEQNTIFEKATEKLIGVHYVPVAYLGSQVVAGTNHCFLCKATVIYPNATPSYVLMYIYEDLQNQATVTQITEIDLATLSQSAE